MMPHRRNRDEEARADEPAETRDLTKKNLYKRLAEDWYLPDNNSRGITRTYLVGIFTNAHFRVGLVEMKQFLATLTSAQLKKAPYHSTANALAKINTLLAEMGLRPLGFPAGVIPEDGWLMNIARFIDRENISGLFLQAVPGFQNPDTQSGRMYRAKQRAEDFLLGADRLLENRQVYATVEEIWESQKRLVAKECERQVLQQQLVNVEQRMVEERAVLGNAINQASMTIYTFGNNVDNADRIFMEDEGERARLQLNEISNM